MKFIFLIISLLSFKSFASEELIQVENVVISIAAKNASLAKEEAINSAAIFGFKKKYPNYDQNFLNKNRENIENALREFEIVRENVLPGGYKVIMNLSFSAAALEKITTGKSNDNLQALLSEPKNSKTLVIPLFRHSNILSSWEDNPWLDSWQANESEVSKAGYIVPLGDLDDINLTRFNMLLAGYDRFKPIMQKYGADKLLIFLAETKSDYRNHEHKLSIYRKEVTSQNTNAYLNKFTEIVQDNKDFFFAKAVQDVLNTKFDKLFDFDNLAIQANDLIEFQAFIFTNDYEKVSNILDSLERAPKIKTSRVIDFSNNYLYLNISTSAKDIEEIRKALSLANLNLVESGGVFVLK
jgi:hypothetical protein